MAANSLWLATQPAAAERLRMRRRFHLSTVPPRIIRLRCCRWSVLIINAVRHLRVLALSGTPAPTASPSLSTRQSSATMVVSQQWTGTEADRHDMERLQLEQVLRVSAPPSR